MANTVRNRFVAIDLAEGWIELGRQPWRVRHIDRAGTLRLSMFPVTDGITMDLARLLSQERLGERRLQELMSRVKLARPMFAPKTLLEEVTWSERSTFCLSRREQCRYDRSMPLLGASAGVTYGARWTVSDGRYMLEASIGGLPHLDDLRVSVGECDAMMRSVRFEGPN